MPFLMPVYQLREYYHLWGYGWNLISHQSIAIFVTNVQGNKFGRQIEPCKNIRLFKAIGCLTISRLTNTFCGVRTLTCKRVSAAEFHS
jgi:hypothetical protein